MSWGTGVYDFDNDGIPTSSSSTAASFTWFRRNTRSSAAWATAIRRCLARQPAPFFDVKTVARGACFADYDNDGKMDAFIVNLGAPARCCITSRRTEPLDLPSS